MTFQLALPSAQVSSLDRRADSIKQALIEEQVELGVLACAVARQIGHAGFGEDIRVDVAVPTGLPGRAGQDFDAASAMISGLRAEETRLSPSAMFATAAVAI